MPNVGIQPGTTAFDSHSLKLDKILKENRSKIESLYNQFKLIKRFSLEEKLKYVGEDCFGFEPDGGAWFYKDKLVAVFEGKKQGVQGNAYERWWDNATTAKYINNEVYYITFCTGPGAKSNHCLDKLRKKAKIMMGERFEFYMAPDGFNDFEIIEIMTNTLKKASNE